MAVIPSSKIKEIIVLFTYIVESNLNRWYHLIERFRFISTTTTASRSRNVEKHFYPVRDIRVTYQWLNLAALLLVVRHHCPNTNAPLPPFAPNTTDAKPLLKTKYPEPVVVYQSVWATVWCLKLTVLHCTRFGSEFWGLTGQTLLENDH